MIPLLEPCLRMGWSCYLRFPTVPAHPCHVVTFTFYAQTRYEPYQIKLLALWILHI